MYTEQIDDPTHILSRMRLIVSLLGLTIILLVFGSIYFIDHKLEKLEKAISVNNKQLSEIDALAAKFSDDYLTYQIALGKLQVEQLPGGKGVKIEPFSEPRRPEKINPSEPVETNEGDDKGTIQKEEISHPYSFSEAIPIASSKLIYDWTNSGNLGTYGINNTFDLSKMFVANDFPRDNILFLSKQNATSKGVQEALSLLFKRAQKGETVVVYFAGHGTIDEAQTRGLFTKELLKHISKQRDESARLQQTDYSQSILRKVIEKEKF